MTKVISIIHEKGGVGKTTSAMNIGAGLVKVGKRVLLVALDQQPNLNTYLGFNQDRHMGISELIYAEVSNSIEIDYNKVVLTSDEGIDYITSSQMLATATSNLGNDRDSQTVLKRIFNQPYFTKYDYIIFDCRPSLDLLVVNALVASTDVIIPVQAEPFALDGITATMDSIRRVKDTLNPELHIAGILITMFDSRVKMAKEIADSLREHFGNIVFQTVIPRLAEAPYSANNQCSLVNSKDSKLGLRYMEVVEELLKQSK